MTQPRRVYFSHPEPDGAHLPLIPFFLPFAGCPQQCVFCDQHRQTGRGPVAWDQVLDELQSRLTRQTDPFCLGFFGGTFTGLSVARQDKLLETARRFAGNGRLGHIRISTRPDMVTAADMKRLKDQGVSMVELGIQTFSHSALTKSGRGYGPDTAREACRLVHDAGLELGIQLLPGLPGHDQEMWAEDVQRAITEKPAVVRIYPCVVMKGTELGRMFRHGEYTPWTLDMAVEESGWAVLRFWEAGIRVIRLGLAAEQGMLEAMLAGPWHPAFGNMVRSRALLQFLEQTIRGLDGSVTLLSVPKRHSGELWGHGRSNVQALARLGVDKSRVRFWNQSEFALEWEEA